MGLNLGFVFQLPHFVQRLQKPKAWILGEYFPVGWLNQQVALQQSKPKNRMPLLIPVHEVLIHERGKPFGYYNTHPIHLVSMPMKHYICNDMYIYNININKDIYLYT